MSKKLNMLMLAIITVGALHMGEQLMTSIEEFYMIREAFGGWYGMFSPAYADHASVLLITIVFTAISLVFYALMRGGAAPLALAGVFGALGVAEAHHWIEAAQEGGYDPGVVTSVAYVGVGALILAEVVAEVRARARTRRAATSPA